MGFLEKNKLSCVDLYWLTGGFGMDKNILMLSFFLSMGGLFASENPVRIFEIHGKDPASRSSLGIVVNMATGVILDLNIIVYNGVRFKIGHEAVSDCKKYVTFDTEKRKFIFSGPIAAFALSLLANKFSLSFKKDPLSGCSFSLDVAIWFEEVVV